MWTKVYKDLLTFQQSIKDEQGGSSRGSSFAQGLNSVLSEWTCFAFWFDYALMFKYLTYFQFKKDFKNVEIH